MIKKSNIIDKKYQDEIISLKKDLLNLRFQKFSGQLEKTSQIKNNKKKIAQLMTKISKNTGEQDA